MQKHDLQLKLLLRIHVHILLVRTSNSWPDINIIKQTLLKLQIIDLVKYSNTTNRLSFKEFMSEILLKVHNKIVWHDMTYLANISVIVSALPITGHHSTRHTGAAWDSS